MPSRLIGKLTLFFLLAFGAAAFCAEQIPAPVGWVNDFAGVLKPEHKEKLDAQIRELELKTGAEIMVLTVSSIAPYGENEYARLIFDNWKPGKKGKDNGVLVLLAIKERRWRIETGYGVEGILPDGKCGEIGRNYMVPYFKDGNFDAGIYSGVQQIIGIIAKDAQVQISNIEYIAPRVSAPANAPNNTFFLPVFALFFFTVWNIPWPIFIGLPFTLLFATAFLGVSRLAAGLAIGGYIAAMFIRHNIWLNTPEKDRKSFLWVLIWGLAALNLRGTGTGYGGGGFSGGGFGGGGFGGGGFGGGGGGGGGF